VGVIWGRRIIWITIIIKLLYLSATH
jgi:hypothetical protein